MIVTILLAAGRSVRMGQTKQLMPFADSTILEQTIDRYLASNTEKILVVLGYQADEIKRTIADKPVRIITNIAYENGMSTSIIAALKLLDIETEAIMIGLGDQPLIDSRTIDKLIDEYHRQNKGIIIPLYHKKRGHPIIMNIKYKKELLEMTGDAGAREIIHRHQEDTLEVPVTDEGVCVDIDTPDSYQSAVKRWNETTG